MDDFSEKEKAKVVLLIRGAVQAHMSQLRLYEERSFLRRDWEPDGNWAAQFRRLPLVQTFYDETVSRGQIAPDFLVELDRRDALAVDEKLLLFGEAIEDAQAQE